MKQQWTFIFALVFALIIALFSVMNVEAVPVNYMFGEAYFPLIMVIIGSALIGGLIAGLLTTIPMFRQRRTIRALQKETAALKESLAQAEQKQKPQKTGSEVPVPAANDKATGTGAATGAIGSDSGAGNGYVSGNAGDSKDEGTGGNVYGNENDHGGGNKTDGGNEGGSDK